MPSVGQQGIAADTSGFPGHDLEKEFLQADDHDEQEESPGGGGIDDGAVGGGDELGDAVVGNEGPGGRQNEGPDDGGEGLGLSVAVGVLGVGWLGSVLEGSPDQERAEEVEEGLNAVGDQGVGAADQSPGDLAGREEQVQEDPGEDGTPPLGSLVLEITVGHSKLGIGNGKWVIGQSSNQQLGIHE